MDKKGTKKNEIKEKIIDSTMKLIEKQGKFDISIRDIIEEANVNIAAINYYFGSKDTLIHKVEQKATDFLKEIKPLLEDETIEPKVRIYNWCEQLIFKLMKSPALFHIIYNKLLLNNSVDPELEQIYFSSNQLIQQLLTTLNSNLDQNDLIYKAILINSSIIFPLFFYDNSKRFFGINFQNDISIKNYLKTILNATFGKPIFK